MLAIAIVFWVCAALLVYTQLGYGVLLWLMSKFVGAAGPLAGSEAESAGDPAELTSDPTTASNELPRVAVIVAAYHEQDVIGARVENLRALDYPADSLQIVVAVDGGAAATEGEGVGADRGGAEGADQTAARARAAGADLVLELERGGKVVAQDSGVAALGAEVELLAFSDANAVWEPDALKVLVAAFTAEPKLGYACGSVSFLSPEGDNQEGLYWRYEMWLRAMESRLASITAGNGAIYAVRRAAYFTVGRLAGHDLAFPAGMVKRGWRAAYVPAARATEKMAPSIDGEFARKRRMARRTWPTMFADGLMSLRGYSPRYALMIYSHRVLRYLVPFLHLIALVASVVLVAAGAGWVYIAALAAQLALLVAAALAGVMPGGLPKRLAAIARYYVATNAALAIGLWDYLRGDRSPVWETVEGTR